MENELLNEVTKFKENSPNNIWDIFIKDEFSKDEFYFICDILERLSCNSLLILFVETHLYLMIDDINEYKDKPVLYWLPETLQQKIIQTFFKE